MNQRFKPTIGLEVHVQLKTGTKLFCSCPVLFGAPPNTLTCPVCAGHPGSLPVLNETAVYKAISAGLCFGCEVSEYTAFDRKNYFYPDLPKGFQITQYYQPLCCEGFVEVKTSLGRHIVKINHLHIEEDSGKSVHDAVGNRTLIDLNRCGVPLIEIVTDPDIHSSSDAHEFLVTLRRILRYAEVSDCEMQEGGLRVDVNISVARPDDALGVPVEIKNLGSFKAVVAAIDFEIARQTGAKLRNETVVRETRLYDEVTQTTVRMRGKEDIHDYRYLPEPDIPPFHIKRSTVREIRKKLCKLPAERTRQYVDKLGLTEYEAGVLTEHRDVADFFDATIRKCKNAKEVCNWMLGEVLALRNEHGGFQAFGNVTPEGLAQLVKLVLAGVLTRVSARAEVWPQYAEGKGSPQEIAARLGLTGKKTGESTSLVGEIIGENPEVAQQIRDGKTRAVEVLVGIMMKRTKGVADPGRAREEFLGFIAEQGN